MGVPPVLHEPDPLLKNGAILIKTHMALYGIKEAEYIIKAKI